MHRVRYLIGILTLVAAIVGGFWIVRLLNQLDDRPGVAVQIEFHDARGLRAGSDVRYRGVHAGTVRAVDIAEDGSKAVVSALLDPGAAAHARVNSGFWIVTPRFGGITRGATGLDTLVRDAYLAFHTPAEPGSMLAAGSLVAGLELPPVDSDAEKLGELERGDLTMRVLLPENHGLRVGSPVTFRGMKTGEVRAVDLAPDGSHVTASIRILRSHRQTVTDKVVFWVARPQLSGALFTGFRVDDVNALLAPYLSYYSAPGVGLPVEDGHRTVALASRPDLEVAEVPAQALRGERRAVPAEADDLVVVRIVYAATERDTFSPNDAIRAEGSGVMFLDQAGRCVVVTARSLVDGSYLERDVFGGAPDIFDEQIKVMPPSGTVLHAGRVWVHPEGVDLAVLVLTDTPADLRATPADLLAFQETAEVESPYTLRRSESDGSAQAPEVFDQSHPQPLADYLGAAAIAGGKVRGVYGRTAGAPEVPIVVALSLLPADLRPQ